MQPHEEFSEDQQLPQHLVYPSVLDMIQEIHYEFKGKTLIEGFFQKRKTQKNMFCKNFNKRWFVFDINDNTLSYSTDKGKPYLCSIPLQELRSVKNNRLSLYSEIDPYQKRKNKSQSTNGSVLKHTYSQSQNRQPRNSYNQRQIIRSIGGVEGSTLDPKSFIMTLQNNKGESQNLQSYLSQDLTQGHTFQDTQQNPIQYKLHQNHQNLLSNINCTTDSPHLSKIQSTISSQALMQQISAQGITEQNSIGSAKSSIVILNNHNQKQLSHSQNNFYNKKKALKNQSVIKPNIPMYQLSATSTKEQDKMQIIQDHLKQQNTLAMSRTAYTQSGGEGQHHPSATTDVFVKLSQLESSQSQNSVKYQTNTSQADQFHSDKAKKHRRQDSVMSSMSPANGNSADKDMVGKYKQMKGCQGGWDHLFQIWTQHRVFNLCSKSLQLKEQFVQAIEQVIEVRQMWEEKYVQGSQVQLDIEQASQSKQEEKQSTILHQKPPINPISATQQLNTEIPPTPVNILSKKNPQLVKSSCSHLDQNTIDNETLTTSQTSLSKIPKNPQLPIPITNSSSLLHLPISSSNQRQLQMQNENTSTPQTPSEDVAFKLEHQKREKIRSQLLKLSSNQTQVSSRAESKISGMDQPKQSSGSFQVSLQNTSLVRANQYKSKISRHRKALPGEDKAIVPTGHKQSAQFVCLDQHSNTQACSSAVTSIPTNKARASPTKLGKQLKVKKKGPTKTQSLLAVDHIIDDRGSDLSSSSKQSSQKQKNNLVVIPMRKIKLKTNQAVNVGAKINQQSFKGLQQIQKQPQFLQLQTQKMDFLQDQNLSEANHDYIAKRQSVQYEQFYKNKNLQDKRDIEYQNIFHTDKYSDQNLKLAIQDKVDAFLHDEPKVQQHTQIIPFKQSQIIGQTPLNLEKNNDGTQGDLSYQQDSEKPAISNEESLINQNKLPFTLKNQHVRDHDDKISNWDDMLLCQSIQQDLEPSYGVQDQKSTKKKQLQFNCEVSNWDDEQSDIPGNYQLYSNVNVKLDSNQKQYPEIIVNDYSSNTPQYKHFDPKAQDTISGSSNILASNKLYTQKHKTQKNLTNLYQNPTCHNYADVHSAQNSDRKKSQQQIIDNREQNCKSIISDWD